MSIERRTARNRRCALAQQTPLAAGLAFCLARTVIDDDLCLEKAKLRRAIALSNYLTPVSVIKALCCFAALPEIATATNMTFVRDRRAPHIWALKRGTD